MQWTDNLPDASTWVPRKVKRELKRGLQLTCRAIDARIQAEAEIERRFNIDNYDSGPGVEDIVRGELQKILPWRYSVEAGVTNDRQGQTAGDCDVVVLNRFWAPAVKIGATPDSRRWHFPIEAVYSVIEIKQSLNFKTLDEALAKVVKCSRLERPLAGYGQIVENQHIETFDRDGWTVNPLATFILGVGLREDIAFEDLAKRFFAINHQLARSEKVHALVVLGKGIAFHSVSTEQGGWITADFMRDRDKPLLGRVVETERDAFYYFYVLLADHLNRSVLTFSNLTTAYGKWATDAKPLDSDQLAELAQGAI